MDLGWGRLTIQYNYNYGLSLLVLHTVQQLYNCELSLLPSTPYDYNYGLFLCSYSTQYYCTITISSLCFYSIQCDYNYGLSVCSYSTQYYFNYGLSLCSYSIQYDYNYGLSLLQLHTVRL